MKLKLWRRRREQNDNFHSSCFVYVTDYWSIIHNVKHRLAHTRSACTPNFSFCGYEKHNRSPWSTATNSRSKPPHRQSPHAKWGFPRPARPLRHQEKIFQHSLPSLLASITPLQNWLTNNLFLFAFWVFLCILYIPIFPTPPPSQVVLLTRD